MTKPIIDKDKLRAYIRKERGEALLVFLDRAIDLLPASKLPRLIKNYARPERFWIVELVLGGGPGSMSMLAWDRLDTCRVR